MYIRMYVSHVHVSNDDTQHIGREQTLEGLRGEFHFHQRFQYSLVNNSGYSNPIHPLPKYVHTYAHDACIYTYVRTYMYATCIPT